MTKRKDSDKASVQSIVTSPEVATSTITTKTHSRKVTENEVVRSDRIELVQQANQFVGSIVSKTTLPKIGSGYAPEVEMSECELRAYASALDFLRRQFDQGYSDSEAIQKRAEMEDTTERKPIPALERSP